MYKQKLRRAHLKKKKKKKKLLYFCIYIYPISIPVLLALDFFQVVIYMEQDKRVMVLVNTVVYMRGSDRERRAQTDRSATGAGEEEPGV